MKNKDLKQKVREAIIQQELMLLLLRKAVSFFHVFAFQLVASVFLLVGIHSIALKLVWDDIISNPNMQYEPLSLFFRFYLELGPSFIEVGLIGFVFELISKFIINMRTRADEFVDVVTDTVRKDRVETLKRFDSEIRKNDT